MSENFTQRLTASANAFRAEIAKLEPGDVPDRALEVIDALERGLLEYAAMEAA